VERADAAVVLGHAVWGTEPSPIGQARLDHAIGLYRAGRVRKLILTGCRWQGEAVSIAAASRAYVLDRGVAPGDVLIEERSRTTFQNLYYAKPIAEAHGLRTLVVVSDPLHLRRAMRMAHDLGLAAWPSGTPTSRIVGVRRRAQFVWREVYLYLGYRLARRFPATNRPERL
jgi:uncharacterized SAM-binding protein YcdF (DUF218 family)